MSNQSTQNQQSSQPARPVARKLAKRQSNGQPVSTQLNARQPQPKRRSFFQWTGFSNKTLWDWLQLLLIPVLLAAGGIWFQTQQHDSDQTIAQANRQKDIQIAVDNREQDRLIADDQQQALTLKAYMDDMTELLLHEGLRESRSDAEVRVVARTKTSVTLTQLDGGRKGTLLQFLYEAHLINGKEPIISLQGVNLYGLQRINANLEGINLHGADLENAILSGSNLSRADLSGVEFYEAHCKGSLLVGTNLSGADLTDTDLYCSDLTDANLRGAKVTKEQLAQAYALKDAILPDGSTYPYQSYTIP